MDFFKSAIQGSALVLVLFILNSCQTSTKPVQLSPQEQKSWAGNMHDLEKVISDLLPMAMTEKEFNDPKNKQQIEEDVKALVSLSKSVKHDPVADKKDPSIKFISTAFVEDVERLDSSLRNGKREYARYTVANMTSYCIECHTRTSSGPSFNSAKMQEVFKNFSNLQRGQYLLATRQYDSAFDEFMKELDRGLQGTEDFFNVDKAVKYSLSIAVKFKKDPQLAEKVVKRILDSKSSPYYLQQNAQAWKIAIGQWKKEKLSSGSSIESRLQKANLMIEKGQKLQTQNYGRGGDIYFMRALSDLHLILAQKPTNKYLGQALYLTGVGYELAKDMESTDLSENYFEDCIRKSPGSIWAQKSFRYLEESIYLGYTGSSGTSIPSDIRKKLEALRAIAFSSP